MIFLIDLLQFHCILLENIKKKLRLENKCH